MACICRQKLSDDYKSCARIKTAAERKLPNDPDYFGEDELNFIQSFGGNMRQNFQQIRHLKATSTGTARTLHWLLQGDLYDQDNCLEGVPGATGRRYQRGRHRAEINKVHGATKGAGLMRGAGASKGSRASKGAGANKGLSKGGRFYKDAGFSKSPAFFEYGNWKMGLNSRALPTKGDTDKPLVPLTYCFNEDGCQIPCESKTDKAACFAHSHYGPGDWLRSDGELHGLLAERDKFSMENNMWLELVSGQLSDGNIFGEDGATYGKARAYGKTANGGGFGRAGVSENARNFRAPLLPLLTRQALNANMRSDRKFIDLKQALNTNMLSDRKLFELLTEDLGREHERLKALKTLYAEPNEPPKVVDEEELRKETTDIYKFYAATEQTLNENFREIEKLDFAELIELLKKEGHKKFEPVLFHEPFDPEKPWTWMKMFPKEIPEKYMKLLSENALMILRDWQTKQNLVKADKARRKEVQKKKKIYFGN